MTQEAVDLKNQGNKAFASGDWPGAISFYSQAIEKHATEPTFYTNRAQVSLGQRVGRFDRVTNQPSRITGVH